MREWLVRCWCEIDLPVNRVREQRRSEFAESTEHAMVLLCVRL